MKRIASLPPTYSALIAVISYALAYALIASYSRQFKLHPYTVIAFYSIFSGIYAVTMRQVLGIHDLPPSLSYAWIAVSALLLLIGAFITSGDYFNVRALQAGDIVTTTSIMSTLPAFAKIFEYILDREKGEKPSIQAIIGYVVTFIGVMIVMSAPQKSK